MRTQRWPTSYVLLCCAAARWHISACKGVHAGVHATSDCDTATIGSRAAPRTHTGSEPSLTRGDITLRSVAENRKLGPRCTARNEAHRLGLHEPKTSSAGASIQVRRTRAHGFECGLICSACSFADYSRACGVWALRWAGGRTCGRVLRCVVLLACVRGANVRAPRPCGADVICACVAEPLQVLSAAAPFRASQVAPA